MKDTVGPPSDVETYVDGYDSLLAIGDQKPDGVVMDVAIPSLDAAHCIRRIRSWEELQHTRVVVFAADATDRQACVDAGASAFVIKPATEELLRAMRRAFGQR